MALHPDCDVEVGSHDAPFWESTDWDGSKLKVCTRHRHQFEERADEFGPFNWKRQE